LFVSLNDVANHCLFVKSQGIFLFDNRLFEICSLAAIPSIAFLLALNTSLVSGVEWQLLPIIHHQVKISFARPKLGNQLNDPLLLQPALLD
jgi:hypothetical protein